MKTLKIMAALCFMVAFTATNANCQKTSGEYEWSFGGYPQVTECIGEELSGTITVEWTSTKSTYHEKGRGILIGVDSREEYTISFEYNSVFHWHQSLTNGGYTFPMLLKVVASPSRSPTATYSSIAFL